VFLPAPALRPLPGHSCQERRNRGVEAQCLCQRPPSAFSQIIAVKVERLTVVLKCSVSASARPAPSPKQQHPRRSTVSLHRAFKSFNLSRSPLPSGNCSPRLACTTASAFYTAVRIVFDVCLSAMVLLAGSILWWIVGEASLHIGHSFVSLATSTPSGVL